MEKSIVIIFWVRKLFYDLKLLPCVFFLLYVMGSKSDRYGPVVREKEGPGDTVMVWGFSWAVPIMKKEDWSLSWGSLDSTHPSFPGPLVAVAGGGTCFTQGVAFSGNMDDFQDSSGIAGDREGHGGSRGQG